MIRALQWMTLIFILNLVMGEKIVEIYDNFTVKNNTKEMSHKLHAFPYIYKVIQYILSHVLLIV